MTSSESGDEMEGESGEDEMANDTSESTSGSEDEEMRDADEKDVAVYLQVTGLSSCHDHLPCPVLFGRDKVQCSGSQSHSKAHCCIFLATASVCNVEISSTRHRTNLQFEFAAGMAHHGFGSAEGVPNSFWQALLIMHFLFLQRRAR